MQNESMTTTLFNINDMVRVKLTPHGRAFHAMQHAMENMKNGTDFKYDPPIEDAEGWSEWQLWVLMNAFGEQLFNGNTELPFEPNIQLIQEA